MCLVEMKALFMAANFHEKRYRPDHGVVMK